MADGRPRVAAWIPAVAAADLRPADVSILDDPTPGSRISSAAAGAEPDRLDHGGVEQFHPDRLTNQAVARAVGAIHFSDGDKKCEPMDVLKHLTSDYLRNKFGE